MRIQDHWKSVLCLGIFLTGLASSAAWGAVPGQAGSPARSALDAPTDRLLAKEIDIHLEKKTGPAPREEPDMELKKQMPEPAAPEPEPQPEVFEEDPFATDEPDSAEIQPDKLEGFNRAMHDVNDTIYQYFFRPLARGYREVVPEEGRIAVGNAFDNLKAPAKLLSTVVQGDADKSGRVVGRFLINSTLGMGGMLDVAGEEYGIENVDEDFGQALASRGVSSGEYLVLPFFGPTTTRDAVGQVVDSALNPANYFGVGFLANAAINTSERVNRTSFMVDDIDQLNESAIDPYESQRHFYLELREKQIKE